jgi:hypothetical protein
LDTLRACRRHATVVRAALLRAEAAGTLRFALDETTDAGADSGCQPGGVAALPTDEELAPPIYDDDAFLFLTVDEGEHLHDADGDGITLDEGGQLQDTERVGIATARETAVCDGNDLVRIYGQSLQGY